MEKIFFNLKKYSQSHIAYHVTNQDFAEIGGNSGIGIHVTEDIEAAYVFASEWYSKKPFYVMKFSIDIKNPLNMDDIGMFNSPSGFLTELRWKNIITDNQYKKLAMEFGGSKKSRPTDYYDYNDDGKRDTWNGKNTEFNEEDLNFLKLEGLPYLKWENVRKFLKSIGYDGLKYHNRLDAPGTCYVVFYQNQISMMSKKQYANLKQFDEDIEMQKLFKRHIKK